MCRYHDRWPYIRAFLLVRTTICSVNSIENVNYNKPSIQAGYWKGVMFTPYYQPTRATHTYIHTFVHTYVPTYIQTANSNHHYNDAAGCVQVTACMTQKLSNRSTDNRQREHIHSPLASPSLSISHIHIFALYFSLFSCCSAYIIVPTLDNRKTSMFTQLLHFVFSARLRRRNFHPVLQASNYWLNLNCGTNYAAIDFFLYIVYIYVYTI